MNKNMSIRDRIAMHVAISEMVYSPKLNEAYMALANGRRASSRWEKPMCWGFVIDDGGEHYCSLSCLHKHYSSDEYSALYNHGKGNSYYTSWID